MNKYFESRFVFHEDRKKIWKALSEHLQKEISPNASLLELGAGYCDFINQIKAKKKYAADINPEVKNFCNEDVTFIHSNVAAIQLEKNSVDVIFASNLLEHLSDEQLDLLFNQINEMLNPGGKIILMQPNYYYCYREYWDDYTHIKAFSHISLCDFLRNKNFTIKKVIKKFMPFSFYSPFPKSYYLTKLYLSLPYHPFAKQMLIIAEKVK